MHTAASEFLHNITQEVKVNAHGIQVNMCFFSHFPGYVLLHNGSIHNQSDGLIGSKIIKTKEHATMSFWQMQFH